MCGIDIVLASGSPRRRELLQTLGWDFRVVVPETDETPRPGETPQDLCLRLSALKADTVAKFCVSSIVVAADTIVVVDGAVLGKPAGRDEALQMLRRLQGRAHEVMTGVSVVWKSERRSAVERTRVFFRGLDEDAMRVYADSGEGLDKAGAYAIQGKGSLLVASIEGDYFNVVGLPLCRLSMMLEDLGLRLAGQWSGA